MSTVSLLERQVYLYHEVDKIVALRPGTARRWINGYRRAGKTYDPILRLGATDSEWVTWGEFVEARILSEYRDQKIRTVRLRAAVEHLRELYGVQHPLAHLRPYLAEASGELLVTGKAASGVEGDDESQMIARTGQMLLADGLGVVRHSVWVEENGEKVASELPADDQFDGIVVNPHRFGGQPTFVGRRVAVATIAGMVAAGERRDNLATVYGLSLAQVDDAVRFADIHKLAA